MKSYTDLEQSKKLAEILPLESADMYIDCTNPYYIHTELKHIEHFDSEHYPCWSLASLLDVLPMIRKGKDIANPFITKTPDNEYYVVYATLKEEVDSSAMYDNPVDSCVAMIEKLNELNLL